METLINRIYIDGHLASGKSSIATLLAERSGGTVVRPFKDEEAAELWGYVTSGDFESLDRRARAILAKFDHVDGNIPVIFDRHWFTIAVHLPENLRDRWPALPHTYVCWADIETTVRRLLERAPQVPDVAFHSHFLNEYRGLAERRGIPLIETSRLTGNEAASQILTDLTRSQLYMEGHAVSNKAAR